MRWIGSGRAASILAGLAAPGLAALNSVQAATPSDPGNGAWTTVSGPSFPCPSPSDPLAGLICSSAELSRTDRMFVQAYQALRQQAARVGGPDLRQESLAFGLATRAACHVGRAVPSGSVAPLPPPSAAGCVEEAYHRQTAAWAARLTGSAAEEAVRAPERQAALQQRLAALHFLPAGDPADGLFSATTRTAIAAWQGASGREPSGLLGDADAAALLQESPHAPPSAFPAASLAERPTGTVPASASPDPVPAGAGVDLDAPTLEPKPSAPSPQPSPATELSVPDATPAGAAGVDLDAAVPPPAPARAMPAPDGPGGRVAAFVDRYFASWSQDNARALASLDSLYAAEVDFYGRPISRATLLGEKRAYTTRWPVRTYTLRPGTLAVACAADGSACTASGLVDWDCRSPERAAHSSGSSAFTLRLTLAGGSPTIVSEGGAAKP